MVDNHERHIVCKGYKGGSTRQTDPQEAIIEDIPQGRFEYRSLWNLACYTPLSGSILRRDEYGPLREIRPHNLPEVLWYPEPGHRSIYEMPRTLIKCISYIEGDQDTQMPILDHPLGCIIRKGQHCTNGFSRSHSLAEPILPRGQTTRNPGQ